MSSLAANRQASFPKWMSTCTVVASLIAIGWWGHSHHWMLPTLWDFKPSLLESKASVTEPPVPEHTERFPAQLPTIDFSSADAVRNCGIATELASERSMTPAIGAAGTVGYDQTRCAQLSSRVAGTVWRVDKRLGDEVKTGDILAIFDSTDVGDAKASLLETTVVHHLNSENFQNLKSVRGAVPGKEIRRAEAETEVSRVKQFNAVQRLANFGFPIRTEHLLHKTVDELSQYLLRLGLPESVAMDTRSANLIPLRSPFDGIITKCDIVRGEKIDPAVPAYIVADTRRIWIHLNVGQEDANRLKLGTKVSFEWNGSFEPASGILTWIGTEMDAKTRTVRARAEADNPLLSPTEASTGPRALQVNVFGTARIEIGSPSLSVVVPNEALRWQWEIGQEVVFATTDDECHFQPRIVTKGRVVGEQTEILDGLKTGERVVTSGSRVLTSELSDRLQRTVGDNASAVRRFDHPRTLQTIH
jgi:cobalt-zinc-cadmium efflux system membrane fusion protein